MQSKRCRSLYSPVLCSVCTRTLVGRVSRGRLMVGICATVQVELMVAKKLDIQIASSPGFLARMTREFSLMFSLIHSFT